MKTFFVFCTLIFAVTGIFCQENRIETGVYFVLPQDSCAGSHTAQTIHYLPDSLCLAKAPVLTVKDIESVAADSSQLEGKKVYFLNVMLQETSASRFGEVTKKNVGKRMAVIIDNELIMVPIIRDPITSGRLSVFDKRPVIQELKEKLEREMKQP